MTLACFYHDGNTRNAFSRLFSKLFWIIPELTSILNCFAFFPSDPQAVLRAIILDAKAPQAQGLDDELLVYVAKYVSEALSTVLRNALETMVLKACSIHFERLLFPHPFHSDANMVLPINPSTDHSSPASTCLLNAPTLPKCGVLHAHWPTKRKRVDKVDAAYILPEGPQRSRKKGHEGSRTAASICILHSYLVFLIVLTFPF